MNRTNNKFSPQIIEPEKDHEKTFELEVIVSAGFRTN